MSSKQETLKSPDLIARMPVSVPVLSPFHGGDFYYLREPISWLPEGADAGQFPKVEVPEGFVTDLTSVPAIFWTLLPKDGPYMHAAIVHDYAYWTQTSSRDVADEVLRIGMNELEVSGWKITAIYRAVRAPFIGGARAWGRNSQLKAAGEKRFLKRYPTDPRTTWMQWKEEPGVFAS